MGNEILEMVAKQKAREEEEAQRSPPPEPTMEETMAGEQATIGVLYEFYISLL